MSSSEELFRNAVTLHQAGNLNLAETLYRDIIATRPEHWDARYLLGTVLLQQGRCIESIPFLKSVAENRPDVPDAGNNLGIAYQAVKRLDDAKAAFEATLERHPDYGQAAYNLARLESERGAHKRAESWYRHGLRLVPDDRATWHGLAKCLVKQRKWAEADRCYETLSREPFNDPDATAEWACLLAERNQFSQAAELFHQAIALRPDDSRLHCNASYVHEKLGQFDEAIAGARRAIQLNPKSAQAHNNLGVALRSLHQCEAACDSFQTALSLEPSFGLAAFNLGTTRLLQGQYQAGWSGYERRYECGEVTPRNFQQPRWRGQAIDGKRLLIYSDQGAGDAIQFIRFITMARNRSGATIVVECPAELRRLFSRVDGIDCMISPNDTVSFDWQIPLASLPVVLDVTFQDIPSDIPYLAGDFELNDSVMNQLNGVSPDQLKVGVVCRGNPRQAQDSVRSCPLEMMQRLARVPGVAVCSVQVGESFAQQIADWERTVGIIDLGRHIRDYADTAAVLQRLDLIVTVDTSVAHLAGALGRPVWTLLCYTPDWRWSLRGTDCPWYPTMRLFRQSVWNDWDTVIEAVAAELVKEPVAADRG